MATIKAFTDIPQSKKLAEFLPPESADVIWDLTNPNLPTIRAIPYEDSDYNNKYLNIIPAWSLAALLSVLPNGIVMNKDSQNGRYHFSSKYIGTYVTADNPVDACYKLILKLNELNLL